MSWKIISGAVGRFSALWILLLFLIPALLAACTSQKPALSSPSLSPKSNPGSRSSPLIKAEWILPEVDESNASVPLSKVTSKKMTHFKLKLKNGNVTFMVYELDGEIFARASVCPPCQGISVSMQKDLLICDTCATIFNAKTGDGVRGACVAYPKASVPYQINGNNIIRGRLKSDG